MRTGLLIVFVLLFSNGCRNKNDIPNNVLSQKKMQQVMWDMMRADQFLADYVLNKNPAPDKVTESLAWYQQIFTIHQVSKEEFQRSFLYYRSHPDLFKQIMDSIASPVAVAVQEPRTHDSTRRVNPVADTMKKKYRNISDTALLRKRKRILSVINK